MRWWLSLARYVPGTGSSEQCTQDSEGELKVPAYGGTAIAGVRHLFTLSDGLAL